jgi:hypothetical protein
VIDKVEGKIRWVRSTDILAGLALFFSSIFFFYDLLAGRYILSERDLGPYFIPPRFFWVESIKNGHFPLWNPYQFSGHPFFANPQHAILYPLNTLFFLLPFDVAFNAIIILHFFLGGLFTYFFLRDLKANRTGSLISGLIFMLSGYFLSVHSLLAILLSVIWAPLIMMFFRRAIANPGLKNEILTAIFITISFLGGGIEIVYGNFLVLLFMVIFFDNPSSHPFRDCVAIGKLLMVVILNEVKNLMISTESTIKILRLSPQNDITTQSLAKGGIKGGLRVILTRVRSLLIVSFLFLFLSAVQLIPFLELFHHSIRGGGISYQEATVWSFTPKDILLFFLPDAYGYFLDMKKYWINQCWFKTLYTGGLPFILSLIFFLAPHPVPLPRGGEGGVREFGKDRKFYLSLMVFSLFLSLGGYNPLYPFVFKYFPFFNGIRYPVKFLYIFILVLAISAGLGFQRMTEFSKENEEKILKNLLIALSLASGLLLLLFILGHTSIEHFLKSRGVDFPDFNYLPVNLHHAKRFLFYLTLFFLLLRIGHEVKWKWWAEVLLIFFLTADLFGNMGFYGKEKTLDYFKKTKILEMISSDKGHCRVFSTAKTIAFDTPLLIAGASPLDIFKEKHLPSMNLLYQLHDIWGIDVIRLKKTDDLFKAFAHTPSISTTNLLDLYGVKYVISVIPIEKDPRFELIYSRLEGLQGKKEDLLKENTVKLYRARNHFPRAWLVKDFKVMDSKAILYTMINKRFNPRKEVLLEEAPPSLTLPRKGGGDAYLALPAGRQTVGRVGGKVEFISETNNMVHLRVRTKENTLLVLSDTYYPGWKVFVYPVRKDGALTPPSISNEHFLSTSRPSMVGLSNRVNLVDTKLSNRANGREEKIYRANYNFRAIPLKAGEYEVKFIYDPISFKIGALVSLLSLVGIVVYFVKRRWRVIN